MKAIVYSVAEAAKIIGISTGYAYKLVNRGKLPVLDLGTRKIVPKEYLDEWLEENKKEAESVEPLI